MSACRQSLIAEQHTMANLPTVTCDDCCACCGHVPNPPFLLEVDCGVPRPIDGADSQADYRRLLTAPAIARDSYLAAIGAVNGPCSWLDATEGRCRFYEFRPDICRSFEVGAKWCSRFRQMLEIE
jgi:uncharacterized protein